MEKIIGIYKITSPTKKIYIGQSLDVLHRFKTYKMYRCKSQPALYNSLIKHGHEKHTFEIIMQCSKEELNQFEIYYIELFQTFNSRYGLNLQSGGYNGSPSDKTKQKLREVNLGKKYSVETNKKKASFTGKKHSDETIAKMKLVKRTDEYKLNISLKLKGKKKSAEHNLNNSIAQTGKKASAETKLKMSMAGKGRILSDETKKRMRVSALNRTPEHYEKIKATKERKRNERLNKI